MACCNLTILGRPRCFRADKNGTQYWSDTENHCTLPGCANVVITTTVQAGLLGRGKTFTAPLPWSWDTASLPETTVLAPLQDNANGELVTRTITYTYDALNRLTAADYSTGEQYGYQYDAVGNRTVYTLTTLLDGTAVTMYTYDAANRLLVAGAPGHSVAYTWDARGNLLSDGTFTYTYNAAGRMVQAQSLTTTLAYTYNADGLRVAQSQSVSSVQSVDTFTWDWATGVPEMLSDGNSLYLVGLDTLGWDAGDDWTYVLPDALGSVRQETDATGAVTAAREWSPYGVEIGGAQTGLGFTGEWWDDAVGLQYLRARWYDSQSGRFTQRDPWRGVQVRPQSLNGWVYTENSPTMHTDTSGMIPTRQDIESGRAEFSCNCGWVDWSHVRACAGLMVNLLAALEYAAYYAGDYYIPPQWTSVATDYYLLDQWAVLVWAPISPLPLTYSELAVVPDSGLGSRSNREDLAISILMDFEERFEEVQGRVGSPTSSFAEEDLVSDLLGFYRGVYRVDDQVVSDKCLTVGKVASLRVFEEVYNGRDVWKLGFLGNTGGFVTGWKHWSPRLLPWRDSCRYNGCCLTNQLCQHPGSGVWPSEFSQFANRRALPNVGGRWWWYRFPEDGFTAGTDRTSVYRLYE